MRRRHLVSVLIPLTVAACGGGSEESPHAGDQQQVQTLAPSCSEVGGSATSKALFTHAVVAADQVRETIVFGSMDPGYLEPINFEQGFKFDLINVPIVAPADLYLTVLEYSEYLTGWRAGETDYGFSFHVCSRDVGGVTQPAVTGNMAHITELSESVKALFDAATFECHDDLGADETARKCRVIFDLGEASPGVIVAGTRVGSAGGTGATDYRPGLDFNLIDFRFENAFVNRERLGSEDGPGVGFRYGACLYDYFPEPHRGLYLSAIGQNGVSRAGGDEPCGTLSVDVAGSAAGVWIRQDKASASYDDAWVEVLNHLLVLTAHPLLPATHQVISTEMADLASWSGDGIAVQMGRESSGDVNVSFEDMVTGPIYCLVGSPFGSELTSFYYYVGLEEGGSRLKLERLLSSCKGVAQDARQFSASAVSFVR